MRQTVDRMGKGLGQVSKDEKGENGEKETVWEAQKGGWRCNRKNISEKDGVRAN